MAITTSSFAMFLWPGINAAYGHEYNEHKPEWPMIFVEKQASSKSFEKDVGITGFGLAKVKTEGKSIDYEDQEQGFITTYTHVTYSKGFIITREMYEDNEYPEIGINRAQTLAFSMRQTEETVGANVLNRAFSDSYPGGDGKALCATDHPNKSGGTWRNELSNPADLSEVSLEQACIDLAEIKSDKGLFVRVTPQRLIIHPSEEFEACRILKSELQSNTANNDLNAMRFMGKIPKGYAVNHYLTDIDSWFLITDCKQGMTRFIRRGHEFKMDNDFDTENGKFKSTFRTSFGWSDPRGIFGAVGA